MIRLLLVPLLLASGLLATDCRPAERPAASADVRTAAGDVAPAGHDARTLEIASWNVEWFGSPGNGPADDGLQLARVRDVIRDTGADVWGMVEVVHPGAWSRLVAQLPGYRAVLASDAAVAGGRAAYGTGEQKPGVLYHTGIASLVGARVILGRHDRAFAGRPPLEVRLRLHPAAGGGELVVIVLHLKAFADDASRERRRLAADALKAYLDATWPTQRVAVIGDWNDDVDTSIVRGRPTPFAAFVADADYRFVTASLSARRVSSTVGHRDLIDHHLVSAELAASAGPDAAVVARLDRTVPDYARTTSDHFPVISTYRLPLR